MRSLFAMIVVTAWAAVHVVRAHGALYWPTPRNSIDNVLPEYKGGKSPTQGCTCSNGNGDLNTGCDLGLRGTSEGLSDGQSCLWWSQGWICPRLSFQYGDAAAFCCGTPGCSIGCEKCATELDGFTAAVESIGYEFVSQGPPNTMFVELDFVKNKKQTAVPDHDTPGDALQPCIYKRR